MPSINTLLASFLVCITWSFPYKDVTRRYSKKLPCGKIDFLKSRGEYRSAHVCEQERHVYFGSYHQEAMVMPALAALGGARRVLIIGGADGGLANCLLGVKEIQEIVLMTGLPVLSRLFQRYLPQIAGGLSDERLTFIEVDPSYQYEFPDSLRQARNFDLIIIDRLWPGEGAKDADPPYEELKELLAPRSLLVQYAASLWDLEHVHHVYHRLTSHFEHVYTQQYSTIDQLPWHEIIFLAGIGSLDVVRIDWSWWRQANITTKMYNEGIHKAMFVPAAMTSRALGLQLPSFPDYVLAQTRNTSISANLDVPKSYKFDRIDANEIVPAPIEKTYRRTGVTVFNHSSNYQNLVVEKHDGYFTMKLDNELQLSSLFADFYHETMVHPAMAVLGPRRNMKVLVIGGGDGGVATAVLRYPVKRVLQVEIDALVVKTSKRFFPELASGYYDSRHRLLIQDAVEYVTEKAEQKASSASGKRKGFDLVVIDSTDVPVESLWTDPFFKSLKRLMSPKSILVQNLGSVGDVLPPVWRHHRKTFRNVHIMNCNSPEYASPYMISMATDIRHPLSGPSSVNWTWWTSLEVPTIYYHPTLHEALFELPEEARKFYHAELHGVQVPKEKQASDEL